MDTIPSNARKVLIIGPVPPPVHGVSYAIQVLNASLVEKERSAVLLDIADHRGLEHINQPDWHDVVLLIRQWFRLIGLLWQVRPGAVYIPISQTTIGVLRDSFFAWPALLFGARLVIHLHGGNFQAWLNSRSAVMRFYVRRLLGNTSKAIVLGEVLRKEFAGLVPDKNIVVIPNGFDWPPQVADQSARAARRGRVTILSLGTVSKKKGIFVLLQAVGLLAQRGVEFELVVAGPWARPEEKQQGDQQIAALGIADLIRWLGHVDGDRKYDAFKAADLFVFPGVQQEGQPLAVIEAMASALPVVYSDRGCLRETAPPAAGGFCVEPGDPSALADALERLIRDQEKRLQAGDAARAHYLACYTQTVHLQQFRAVFAEVLDVRHGSGSQTHNA